MGTSEGRSSRPCSGSASGTRRSSASGSPRRSTPRRGRDQRRDPRPVHRARELIGKKIRPSRVWFPRRSVTRGQETRQNSREVPTMPENQCPSCGAPLPADALGGHCPRCLLLQGLDSDTPGPDRGSNGDTLDLPPGRARCSRRSAPRSATSRACCSATRPSAKSPRRSSGPRTATRPRLATGSTARSPAAAWAPS